RQYLYLPAKVVNNSVNSLSNYITLYRGSADGVEDGMGVIGPQGIVGIVRKTSKHYAVVMSLLHKDTRISAQLLNTGNFGSVKWNISSLRPDEGLLTGIPKNVTVQLGDSVVTSGFSAIFPQGLLIGYVNKISSVSSNNFHRIEIRFATRFQELQYVYVIKNFNAKEEHDLEASVPHE
ncbi:MAG: rod shape-determining protein MreC, partial [Chitinophagaceae bacterium]